MEYDPDTEESGRKEYKDETFSKAFDRNRKLKRPTFFWRGKEYTTELAGSKPAAPTKTGDAAMFRGPQGANLLPRQEQRYPGKREQTELDPRARGIQGLNELPDEERPIPVDAQGKRIGPTIQRAKDLAQEQRIRAAEKARYEAMMRPGRDAIEPIMPEAFLIGPARGGVAALQNALARRKTAKDVVRKGEPEGSLPSATRGGKKDPELELEDFKDYAGGRAEPSFKRGGAVKSHRGDGICKRGHTKGVMR